MIYRRPGPKGLVHRTRLFRGLKGPCSLRLWEVGGFPRLESRSLDKLRDGSGHPGNKDMDLRRNRNPGLENRDRLTCSRIILVHKVAAEGTLPA